VCRKHAELALAAQINYESCSSKELQPAGRDQVLKDPKCGRRHLQSARWNAVSWIVEILPFMDEQHYSIKFDHSSQLFQDQNPQAVRFETFAVPSDKASSRLYKYHDILKTISCCQREYAAFRASFTSTCS